ncbi:hypothetical protein ACFSJY_07990 [Thalassotalea euphylliae]|uniref:hypothetical protein n=1 Tax=Thalassotalea euphylliae TaxID=1655234 RepID=UPI0036408E3A
MKEVAILFSFFILVGLLSGAITPLSSAFIAMFGVILIATCYTKQLSKWWQSFALQENEN